LQVPLWGEPVKVGFPIIRQVVGFWNVLFPEIWSSFLNLKRWRKVFLNKFFACLTYKIFLSIFQFKFSLDRLSNLNMLLLKFPHFPHTIISYCLFFTIWAFFLCSVEGEAKGDLEARETKAFSRAIDLLEMSIWKTKFKQTFGNITFNEQFNETFGNAHTELGFKF
jgi:hypothetical protein